MKLSYGLMGKRPAIAPDGQVAGFSPGGRSICSASRAGMQTGVEIAGIADQSV